LRRKEEFLKEAKVQIRTGMQSHPNSASGARDPFRSLRSLKRTKKQTNIRLQTEKIEKFEKKRGIFKESQGPDSNWNEIALQAIA
jgi:hypothetical protein